MNQYLRQSCLPPPTLPYFACPLPTVPISLEQSLHSFSSITAFSPSIIRLSIIRSGVIESLRNSLGRFKADRAALISTLADLRQPYIPTNPTSIVRGAALAHYISTVAPLYCQQSVAFFFVVAGHCFVLLSLLATRGVSRPESRYRNR